MLLTRLKTLSVFEAAQAQFQSRVELKDYVAILPDFLAGSTVDFDAFGSVGATVDFSKLGTDAVRVNADRSVRISLPRPKLQPVIVDRSAAGW